MKKYDEVAQKMHKFSIGDNYLQIMLGYRDYLNFIWK